MLHDVGVEKRTQKPPTDGSFFCYNVLATVLLYAISTILRG